MDLEWIVFGRGAVHPPSPPPDPRPVYWMRVCSIGHTKTLRFHHTGTRQPFYLHQLAYLGADRQIVGAGPFQKDAVAQLSAPSASRAEHLKLVQEDGRRGGAEVEEGGVDFRVRSKLPGIRQPRLQSPGYHTCTNTDPW